MFKYAITFFISGIACYAFPDDFMGNKKIDSAQIAMTIFPECRHPKPLYLLSRLEKKCLYSFFSHPISKEKSAVRKGAWCGTIQSYGEIIINGKVYASFRNQFYSHCAEDSMLALKRYFVNDSVETTIYDISSFRLKNFEF
jgi:hypothetical protein